MKAAMILTGVAHLLLAAVAVAIAALGVLEERPAELILAILAVAGAAIVAGVTALGQP